MDGGSDLFIKEHQNEIRIHWEKMEKEAMEYYLKGRSEDSEVNGYLQGKVKEHIMKGFNEIFERYGLWYDQDYGWSLSCYYR